ncbi:MAG TPA: hypothetical protein VGA63_01330, partial [Geopsychrobacteraceae bacterium]
EHFGKTLFFVAFFVVKNFVSHGTSSVGVRMEGTKLWRRKNSENGVASKVYTGCRMVTSSSAAVG